MSRHYYVKHEHTDNPKLKRVTVTFYKGGSAAVVTDHNLSEAEMKVLLERAKHNL